MTPKGVSVVREVTLSQVFPLSVDLTMFPELPTATKVLFPNPIPLRTFAVGKVALSQVVPFSVDLTMFPDIPTTTNTPEPGRGSSLSGVVVVPEEIELSFLEHEMTEKLKREIIIMSKIFLSVPQYHPSSVYHLQISNLTFA